MKTISDKYTHYSLPTYGRFPIIPTKGAGTELWDSTGKRYLDFCTGIAVCSIGHSHPRMTQAIQSQAETLLHCSNLYQIPQQAELAELIVEQCVKIPGKVFFSNSGAEANDGLIKTARKFGHTNRVADGTENGAARYEVISFTQSFHGRTLGSMFATGQDAIQKDFDPKPDGFRYLPFNDLDALDGAIRPETAAILLEPIQGEGGIHVASAAFLEKIAALCKEHDLLLLFDEVQAGFGRCGDLMAWKTICPEIEPDGISWAKGMGGGLPIGAFWLSDRAIDAEGTPLSSLMGPKTHGSTYGGNPLVCAGAIACLSEIIEKDLSTAASQSGQHLTESLMQLKHDAIVEIRGKGLLLGVEINPDILEVPEGAVASIHLVTKLMENGLLTVPAGATTVRLLPPLNVSTEEITEAISIFIATLDETVK